MAEIIYFGTNGCSGHYPIGIDKTLTGILSGRFNQEGYEGWELVQWNIMPPAALLTASTTHCCGSIYILATFKKKLRV
nr:MAG TPA: protein of unknown function DUF4177 [Caudoviricetes sp.]